MVKLTFKNFLSLGILAELIILIFFYLSSENIGDIFRMSARYSGRLSLIVYLVCFYHFTFSFIKKKSIYKLNQSVIIFCVLHYIHFIYLSLSVYLNDLPIIPSKLTGGFIAYLMILIYPIVINKIKKIIFHFIYFYYVGIVMVITYLERIRGNFEGAEPELFHYIGLVSIIISLLAFGLYFNKYRRLINNCYT